MGSMTTLIKRWLLHLAAMPRRLKLLVMLVQDGATVLLSLAGAMALRLENVSCLSDTHFWWVGIPLVAVMMTGLGFAGVYRMVIRYVSFPLLPRMVAAVSVAAIALYPLARISGFFLPRSVPVIFAALCLILLCTGRLVIRAMLHRLDRERKGFVIIYGAGAAGRQLNQALLCGKDYLPVAFVDDNPSLHGVSLSDCRVFAPNDIGVLIERYGVTHVLLAVPSATLGERKAILQRLEPYPVHVQTIPGMADLVSGVARVSDFRDISIEELLGRDPVMPRADLMSADIAGQVVMVTGAAGSIGSELCRQIIDLDPRVLVLFEMSEIGLYTIEAELRGLALTASRRVEIVPILGSVRDRQLSERVMRAYGVQTVYHAAAYKHVPIVEENIVEGLRNNVFGTEALVAAAISAGVDLFLLISTDKAVRPTNVMGASKRIAELICQNAATRSRTTRFAMVRFGNVLGSSGSVVPRFREQIEAGGPVTVTHPDVTRYFMTIPEAASLVIQAGAMGKDGDVFLLDMGEPVRIVDLAARMIRLAGFSPYQMDGDERVAGLADGAGDIGITFSGLRSGEKLYEELVIGEDAVPTEHPQIMKANETVMPDDDLCALLDCLREACARQDAVSIRSLLETAPIGYSPSHRMADLVWMSGARLGLKIVPAAVGAA